MPKLPVPPVEPGGVSPQQPFHARDQGGLGRFDKSMKMVAHQAVSMDLPKRLPAGFLQRPQKKFIIQLPVENRVAPDAPILR